MRVLRYQAHNVLRLSQVDLDLEGHHLFLVGGKNGQGKTSALTALLMALCGRSGMDSYPEIALRDGESDGWVKVELSGDEELHEPTGLTVELYLKRKRGGAVAESFRILDSTGEEAPEPRTLLKRLCEVRAFDPLAFEKMDAKSQKALLQKLLNLDFTDSRSEHKRLYDKRTEVNRDASKVKARLDAMPFHKDAPDEEVSTSDLMEELEAAQKVNRQNQEFRNMAVNMNGKLKNVIDDLDAIEKQIQALELKRAELVEEENKMKEAVEYARRDAAKLEDQDESAIRQQIKDADKTNTQVRANKAKIEADAQLDKLIHESEELSERMEAIDQAEKELLKNAKWPVEGMSLDDNGVLLNGLPFSQASKSLRTMVSVDVGCALNPKLKLLVCEDGSDLDSDSLAALDAKLKEKGFQMIVELVTRTQADEDLCAVVVENGALKTVSV